MPPHLRSLFLAVALVAPVAAFSAACSESEPAPPKVGAPVSRVQSVVDAGAPGAIVLANDGRSVRVRAAGAMRPTDRFRTGSITKSFVSAVALELVGEGRLSLSDTVERRLPGILPYGDKVTVHQLLNLTSGVPDDQGPVEAEFLAGNMTRSWSPRELVALVADKKPDFAPGTSWAYSNTNYVLAGLIIERVTGHSLGHELQHRIFDPLHLRHTSFPTDATTIAGAHADGYALVDGEMLDVTVLNPSGFWGAGNLVSTATDVARFWRALLGGNLLAPAQLKAMKRTVPAWEGLRYGLGIMPTPSECGTLWGNGGSVVGYSNDFQSTEDGKRQAAVIVNVNPAAETLGEARDIALEATMRDAMGAC